MSLYRPSELLRFLNENSLRPKKALSQNFLIDGNIVKKILSSANIKENDRVLEIGPGVGVLTEALLAKNAYVTAIEKDKKLFEHLKRFNSPRLTLYNEDFLEFHLEKLKGDFKVVSNLPYSVASLIIMKLVKYHCFSKMALMVQKEVAKRYVAKNKNERGFFYYFLSFYADYEIAFEISRNCFYPRPKVDSAVLLITLKVPPKVDENGFFEMLNRLFCHKRKMIRSIIKGSEIALRELKLNPYSRPSDLELEEHLKLFSRLSADKLL